MKKISQITLYFFIGLLFVSCVSGAPRSTTKWLLTRNDAVIDKGNTSFWIRNTTVGIRKSKMEIFLDAKNKKDWQDHKINIHRIKGEVYLSFLITTFNRELIEDIFTYKSSPIRLSNNLYEKIMSGSYFIGIKLLETINLDLEKNIVPRKTFLADKRMERDKINLQEYSTMTDLKLWAVTGVMGGKDKNEYKAMQKWSVGTFLTISEGSVLVKKE